jgi:transposase InsO family protein
VAAVLDRSSLRLSRPEAVQGRQAWSPLHGDLLAVVEEKGRLTHDFTADRANQKWLTDTTEDPTADGELQRCAIKDCYSNKIVGYSIDSRMKSSLAAAALRNAIALRSPHGSMGRVAAAGTTPPWRISSPSSSDELCNGARTCGQAAGDDAACCRTE